MQWSGLGDGSEGSQVTPKVISAVNLTCSVLHELHDWFPQLSIHYKGTILPHILKNMNKEYMKWTQQTLQETGWMPLRISSWESLYPMKTKQQLLNGVTNLLIIFLLLGLKRAHPSKGVQSVPSLSEGFLQYRYKCASKEFPPKILSDWLLDAK